MLRALERRLHSATAAPAPSRCIRRRRRSTPQPLKGRLFLYDPLKAPLPGELDAPQAQTEGFYYLATPHLPGRFRGGVKTPPYDPAQTTYCITGVHGGHAVLRTAPAANSIFADIPAGRRGGM